MDAGADERKLIESFVSGDERAFDRLVARYRDNIFTLCYRILGDYDEADECAQEAFIKMYRGLASFRMESALSTWLYRIAVNVCKNRMAALASRRRHVAECARRADEAGCREGSSFEPSRIFESQERYRLINAAVSTLPERERLFVVLKDMEGKTYEEIEDITGVKEGTVKSTLARARKKLRIQLKDLIP